MSVYMEHKFDHVLQEFAYSVRLAMIEYYFTKSNSISKISVAFGPII